MRAILIALLLAGCTPAMVTRTEMVEVEALKYVPLPAHLTTATRHPTMPTERCVWEGAPTLCLSDLADWIADWRQALDEANADKAAIREAQPK